MSEYDNHNNDERELSSPPEAGRILVVGFAAIVFAYLWMSLPSIDVSASPSVAVNIAPVSTPVQVESKSPRKLEFTSMPVASYTNIGGYGGHAAWMGCNETHFARDILAREGTPVLSLADGKVIYVGDLYYKGYNMGRGPFAMVVDFGENENGVDIKGVYSHNRTSLFKAGDEVQAGQKIAEVGHEGYSTPPGVNHLHLEVVEGRKFTGIFSAPFVNVCNAYRDVKSFMVEKLKKYFP